MVAMRDIELLSDAIVREFHPQRIILFGSHADGRAGSDSDVDMLVITPCGERTWRMATEIRLRVQPRFPLDLMVRSPEQVARRLEMGDPFLKDVVVNGKVLYEAPDG
jgi:predicted nucleotidyltransferase